MAGENKNGESTSNVALTRREWLLSLGSAVVLAGTSGAPAELWAAQDAPPGPGALPPGLYLPAPDHLAHALSGDDPFHSIPAGAETEYTRPRTGPFVPQAFTRDEFSIIRRLVEMILGEDLQGADEKPVPGAPATIYDEVAEWIDLVVASAPAVRAQARGLSAGQRAVAAGYFGSDEPLQELATFEPERVCRNGLAWLGGESQRRFSKAFLEAPPAEQVELVTSISNARQDEPEGTAGTSFFSFLKAESIRGFYTSSRGLKELDYKGNAFYAESPGCPPGGSPTGQILPSPSDSRSGE